MSEEVKRLLAENDRLHQENLDLLFRQSELTHENRHLWEFIMTCKRFETKLRVEDFHGPDREYVQFVMGLDKLVVWLKQHAETLEQKIGEERV